MSHALGVPQGMFQQIRDNYERLLAWFADLVTRSMRKERSDTLSILVTMTKFSEFFSRLVQRVFSLRFYTHVQLQNPSLSITEVSKLMTELLTMFKAESTEGVAQQFYQKNCIAPAKKQRKVELAA